MVANGHADTQYDFAPVEYDINHVPPRINAGRYQAICKAEARPTRADKLPMLVLEWTAEAVADGNEENEAFVGASVTDYIVLRPEGDPKGRMHKMRLRELLGRLDLDMSLVPTTIQKKSDLEDLIQAVSGQSLDIGITVRTDDNTGEQRENISYRAVAVDGDDAPSEAPPARQPSKPKGKPAPAKGKGGRR